MALGKAAKEGCVECVNTAIAAGADVNATVDDTEKYCFAGNCCDELTVNILKMNQHILRSVCANKC